jgi:hypothetical protein
MPHRKPRTELWVTAATLLAAIAATASAIAAFRQERATFTSALYSKQVDAIGTYLTEAHRLGNNVDAFVVEYKNYSSKAPGTEDRKALASSAQKVSDSAWAFQTLTTQIGLVMPPNYDKSMDDMLGKAFSMEGLVKIGMENALSGIGAAGNDENVKRLPDELSEFDQLWSKIRGCAYKNFTQGKPLQNDNIEKCPMADEDVRASAGGT